MRIMISPAKKMNQDHDSLPWKDLPVFIHESEIIKQHLCKMSYDELKKLWKCNDKIAELNAQRLQSMNLYDGLTPAILSYEGIQYQYMAPHVFSCREFAYIQEYLRILSGFYGVLRPFDGIQPYRLEMQSKLSLCGAKDLYMYWNKRISDHIFSETDCILNLASKEYSMCVSRHLRPGIRFINCVFGEEHQGKVLEKGTMCKMARGEMVRFMAENQITSPDNIKSFSRLDYRFDEMRSTEDTFVFLKQQSKQEEQYEDSLLR